MNELVILNNFLISLEQNSHIADGLLTVDEYINLKDAITSAIKALDEKRSQGSWEGKPQRRKLVIRVCTSCGEPGAFGNFCMWCGSNNQVEVGGSN